MNWLLLEYERGRQIAVCRNMTQKGIIYYHPIELREIKPARNAPRAKSALEEFPLLNTWSEEGEPATIMFLLGGKDTAARAMSTKYTLGISYDDFEAPIPIPEPQIDRFREAVLEWNEAVRKRWERGQATKATERQKFVKMTLETLASLKERQFGGKIA